MFFSTGRKADLILLVFGFNDLPFRQENICSYIFVTPVLALKLIMNLSANQISIK